MKKRDLDPIERALYIYAFLPIRTLFGKVAKAQ